MNQDIVINRSESLFVVKKKHCYYIPFIHFKRHIHQEEAVGGFSGMISHVTKLHRMQLIQELLQFWKPQKEY